MKKAFLFSTILLLVIFVQAQYEPAKNALILHQMKVAKEAVDKGMTNSKFSAKSEAWILKAAVYAGLAMDSIKSPQAAEYMKEADAAFTKYREMQPDLSHLQDIVYQNGPVNLYSAYYTAGYQDYSAKKWQDAFEKYKKVVDLSDLLITQKLLNATIDTNSLIMAGITAENSNHRDDAAKYYSRLADIKLTGTDYESIYRFLVNYYFVKKDLANFEKYKALGKSVYPKSDYFDYDKVDFAVGLEDDFNKKLQAVEEMYNNDPSNYKAALLLGGMIYDTLNSRKEGAVLPSNAAELEAKMVKALQKASELKPDEELPYIYVGDHFITKSNTIAKQKEAVADDIKKRTKPGAQPSKEDVQKRDALEQQYAAAFENAYAPYVKAADVFAKKPKLTSQQKQQYKLLVSYLADVCNYKKGLVKAKPAEFQKLAAEEKKWNDLYDTIK
jgi:hypothetical protein